MAPTRDYPLSPTAVVSSKGERQAAHTGRGSAMTTTVAATVLTEFDTEARIATITLNRPDKR
ncbi:MAG TPA: hypothetical protein VFU78_20960, partial [Thermomicrobiales bacterium]|nr:hypothetical protein [Thermomicrobiales bacterium]